GERPFACGRCGKGFGGASGLRKHERTHGREEEAAGNMAGDNMAAGSDVGAGNMADISRVVVGGNNMGENNMADRNMAAVGGNNMADNMVAVGGNNMAKNN
ncbi:ZN668 protein, partial [Acrocephalus arundinaceus]|nr:ZN668 protein [Acrocephalus arundinaceus]